MTPTYQTRIAGALAARSLDHLERLPQTERLMILDALREFLPPPFAERAAVIAAQIRSANALQMEFREFAIARELEES